MRHVIAIVAVLLPLFACPAPQSGADGGSGGGNTPGTDGGTTGGGGGTWTPLEFCIDSYSAAIDLKARCNEIATGAVADAKAQSEADCRVSSMNLTAPARINATLATQCLASIRAETCATSTVFIQGVPHDCLRAIEGTAAIDGNCFGGECAPGSYCDTSTTCPGTCRARVAIGQMVSAGAQCVEGTEPYDGLCTALVPVGQSCAPTGVSSQQHGCESPAQCGGMQVCALVTMLATAGGSCSVQTGSSCAFGLACISGTCVPLAALGASCAQAKCQTGLFCGNAQTCVPLIESGERCGSQEQCGFGLVCREFCERLPALGEPCPGNRCSDFRLHCARDGRCRQRGGVGAACTYINGGSLLECLPDHYCTQAGTCARRKNNGETCTVAPPRASDECFSSMCPQGTCTGQLYCPAP